MAATYKPELWAFARTNSKSNTCGLHRQQGFLDLIMAWSLEKECVSSALFNHLEKAELYKVLNKKDLCSFWMRCLTGRETAISKPRNGRRRWPQALRYPLRLKGSQHVVVVTKHVPEWPVQNMGALALGLEICVLGGNGIGSWLWTEGRLSISSMCL